MDFQSWKTNIRVINKDLCVLIDVLFQNTLLNLTNTHIKKCLAKLNSGLCWFQKYNENNLRQIYRAKCKAQTCFCRGNLKCSVDIVANCTFLIHLHKQCTELLN